MSQTPNLDAFRDAIRLIELPAASISPTFTDGEYRHAEDLAYFIDHGGEPTGVPAEVLFGLDAYLRLHCRDDLARRVAAVVRQYHLADLLELRQ